MPKLRIVFKQANPDYNQSYAKQYFEGKESPGNYKYVFSRTHFIQVESYELMKNVNYNFIGTTNDDANINSIIKNVNMLKFILTNGKIGDVVISRKLTQKILRGGKRDENTANFYFYFNQRTDYKKIGDSMYLLNEDIPNEIKKCFI